MAATSASSPSTSRPAPLTLPPVTVGGATLAGQVIIAQGVSGEEQWFNVRLQLTPTAAGAWRTVVFPNLSGYAAPQVSVQGDVYAPNVLAANPYPGQMFVWGSTTMYWNTPAAYVNQTVYLNFTVRYVLL